MKAKFYQLTVLFILLTAAFSTNRSYAQPPGSCNCAHGQQANELTYTYVLNPTGSSNNIISFPKFDPTMGTLNCVSLFDTLTVVSSLGIRSMDSADLEYLFRLTLVNNVTGPGISMNNISDTYYGPDSLGKYGSGTDTITYGPDTVFNKVTNSRTNNSNVVPYLGATGNVNFTYSITGGAVSLTGSANFSQLIKTYAFGVFRLTYYWCENSVLSENFSRFTVTPRSSRALFNWKVVNDNPSNRYEIQYSINGRDFFSLESVNAKGSSIGDYAYEFPVPLSGAGVQYFRIKQIDGDGKVRYSLVRRISSTGQLQPSVNVYPNPVVKKMVVDFSRPLTGAYTLEMINPMGQTILREQHNLQDVTTIPVDLAKRPAAGVYYVRVRRNDNTEPASLIRVVVK
jgi:hypothetical protein